MTSCAPVRKQTHVNYTGPTTSVSISHETKKLLIIAASIINARPLFLPRKVSKQRIFLDFSCPMQCRHGVKMVQICASLAPTDYCYLVPPQLHHGRI